MLYISTNDIARTYDVAWSYNIPSTYKTKRNKKDYCDYVLYAPHFELIVTSGKLGEMRETLSLTIVAQIEQSEPTARHFYSNNCKVKCCWTGTGLREAL